MKTISIRSTQSKGMVQPRVFDAEIHDDGEVNLIIKLGKVYQVINLNDVLSQINDAKANIENEYISTEL